MTMTGKLLQVTRIREAAHARRGRAAVVATVILALAGVGMAAVPASAVSALAPSAQSAVSAATTACTDGIAVTQFAFNPTSVPLGSSSPLTLVVQNCGRHAIAGSTDWYGSYTGQNCPVLDPLPVNYTIAARVSYTHTVTYGDPAYPTCQPTALTISANVNVNGIGTVTTVSATLQFTAACTNGIAIKQFSFSPPSVPVGQSSTLTMVLQNCGSQALQGFASVLPEFTWAGTGLPPGCPVMDPFPVPVPSAPGATTTESLGLDDPIASCEATGLQATMNVTLTGVTGTAATATANLVITGAATSS